VFGGDLGMENQGKAKSYEELEASVMSQHEPKSEELWWAKRRIEELLKLCAESVIDKPRTMKDIVVLTKYSQGNDTVGSIQTVARNLDGNLKLWQVYELMKPLGDWDIVIPRNQINPEYFKR